LDAEDRAVVECGGKNGIAFVGRICKALKIPALALHDDDVYEAAEGETLSAKQQQENDRERAANAEIADVFEAKERFVIAPSLEGRLGIGRTAKDKPRRVAEALEQLSSDEFPSELDAALQGLMAAAGTSEPDRHRAPR
jgi:hypothetical protein